MMSAISAADLPASGGTVDPRTGRPSVPWQAAQFAAMARTPASVRLGGAKVEGGDTSCKDYLKANDGDQQTAVSKMLKDEKGTDAAQLEITGTKLSVQTFCQTAGKEDSKIKEAPHL